jgi:hypothetical protein
VPTAGRSARGQARVFSTAAAGSARAEEAGVRPIALSLLLAACTAPNGSMSEPGPGPDSAPDLAEPAMQPDAGAPADDLAKPAPPPPDLAPPKPKKKTLSFTWEGEQKYYMCGPSATRMALSTQMASPPSQDDLGSYMGTTTNGTDDISNVKGALDHYLSTTFQTAYLPNDPPSQMEKDALKQRLVASIDAGYGMVANIVAGWRPPFYPQSGTIYHYIALVGYDADGDQVLVADPAATGCGDGLCGDSSSAFYNVPKSYWIATSDLGEWIVPKGYAWHP